jgi:hypothetical protein
LLRVANGLLSMIQWLLIRSATIKVHALLDSRVFMTNICVQDLSQFWGYVCHEAARCWVGIFFSFSFAFSFSGFPFLNTLLSSRPSREPGLVASLASPSNGFPQ